MMAPNEVLKIKSMLEYRRPAWSQSEESFIARFIDSVSGMYSDDYGNRLLISPGSKVMISVHTDSVHRTDGKQKIALSSNGIVSLSGKEKTSNCLGADDCSGIYAALRMIEAGVKATFVFHRNEEKGGMGSHWLARNYPQWLEAFDVCLALDRRGTQDIITAQKWSKCASEEFASSLATQLDMGHQESDGIFTDSANYVDLIPECSNLSIGYRNEHSRWETLDLNYLEAVIQRLIQVDWNGLEIARVPGDDERFFNFSSLDSDVDPEYMDEWEFNLYSDGIDTERA
jgi:hypothetical protein